MIIIDSDDDETITITITITVTAHKSCGMQQEEGALGHAPCCWQDSQTNKTSFLLSLDPH